MSVPDTNQDDYVVDPLQPQSASTQEDVSSAVTEQAQLPEEQPEPIVLNYEETQVWRDGSTPIDPEKETLSYPSSNQSNTTQILEGMTQSSLGSKADQLWVKTIGASYGAGFQGDGGLGAAERESAQWAQSVKSESGDLRGLYPKIGIQPGVTYTSDAAREVIRSKLKLGAMFNMPLWHTGIWVTLKTPSDGELLELYRLLVQDKIDIGRKTYGLMFSNMQSYTHERLFDFVLEHVFESSYAFKSPQDLRKIIRLPDLNLLIWGMACAAWPSGFQYRRGCLADPEKCHHVIEERINLSKLQWTDVTQLTPRQIKHMSVRTRSKMTNESIELYQSDFTIGQNRAVKISDDCVVILQTPLIKDHLESGFRWVNTIEETYGQAMTQDVESRNEYLFNQSKATMLRQYGHCVHSINLGDPADENTQKFTDTEVIENALNDMSSRDDLRQNFLDGVSKFLDDSIVSFVAIPPYKCPSCGKDQPTSEGKKYPNIISLDAAQTFFQLLVQRRDKIQNRQYKDTLVTKTSD